MKLAAELMEAVPREVARAETRLGFERLEVGKPVYPQRYLQGPRHELRLGDLSAIARPNAEAERQLARFEREQEERLAAEDTEDPGELRLMPYEQH